jgi:hypothetical protein
VIVFRETISARDAEIIPKKSLMDLPQRLRGLRAVLAFQLVEPATRDKYPGREFKGERIFITVCLVGLVLAVSSIQH